ncbi:hypothetical protein Y032_0032g2551 [Ancylostoma ceylanicum]|uniref:Uncharacterized protein n=1 Tax=Ancylostoma ceylanicum TaxID=53326 RepID=A0A016UPU3_9BILA|nr:hypothetical protein Y032_0032g2551 [Ancylostoma ceylanicum]
MVSFECHISVTCEDGPTGVHMLMLLINVVVSGRGYPSSFTIREAVRKGEPFNNDGSEEEGLPSKLTSPAS